MRPTLSLIRREFSAYFYSPIAYVVMAVFLLATGICFMWTVDLLTADGPRGISYPMELMVGNVFWLIFLAIPPLLTMRLLAEERSTGTLEMLLTAPVRDWQIVLAKFVGCYGFFIVLCLPTLVYVPVLTDWHWRKEHFSMHSQDILAVHVAIAAFLALTILFMGTLFFRRLFDGEIISSLVCLGIALVAAALGLGLFGPIWIERKWWTIETWIDPWQVGTTYIGLALVGAMFLSIGLFISSLVRSQLIAALVSIFVGILFIAGMWRPEMDTSSTPYQILYFFTVPLHFERNFGRGLIDTRNIVLYASVTLLCLFLTVRSLESRRWR